MPDDPPVAAMPTPMIPDSAESGLPIELPRSPEPPELWLVRLFGALVLHALLFLSVRLAWAEIVVSQDSGDGGAIAFIEIGEADDQSTSPKAEGVAPLTALKPGAKAKAAIVPDETAVIPQAKPEILPSPSPEPKPTKIPSPTQSPSPISSVEPQPSPSAPQPVVPPKSAPAKPINKPKSSPVKPSLNKPSTAPPAPQKPATSGNILTPPKGPKVTPITDQPPGKILPSQSKFAVTPIVRQSQMTAASAGSVQGSGGGKATLLTVQAPGLTFEFPPGLKVDPGSRFDVNVRIAVSAPTQQIADVDGDGNPEITLLPDSPALKTQQIPPAELTRLVKQALLAYRFSVEYEGVGTSPAELTEWEIQLVIGLD
jgi:hypothetical protein